jgi:hypothetical protein
VRDQVSHPYKTTCNIILIVLHILISMFWDNRQQDERFWTAWILSALNFPERNFDLLSSSKNIWTSPHF